MIKLIDLLFESNVVKIPQEVLSKGKKLYYYTKKNLDSFKKIAPENEEDAYILPKYKIKLKDLKII